MDISEKMLCQANRKDNGQLVVGYYFCMHHNDDRKHIHHFIIPLEADLSKGTPIDKIQVEIDPNSVAQVGESEQKKSEWISVKDRMPEERESIFAKFKGTDKWRPAMFERSSEDVRIIEVFEDGTRRVHHSHTIDGKWANEMKGLKRTVTHWMPNPELPEK